jgi:iron complex transport system substrate-binding protein
MDTFSIHGSLRAPLRRIISLAPSITELLFYLGMGDSVVGLTRQCNYPAAVRDKEVIGSLIMPDVKRILELSPDAVIGLTDLHRHVPDIIRTNDTSVILLDYQTVQDILGIMEAISSLAVEPETGMEIAASCRQRVDSLRNGNTDNRKTRTLFLITESPIMTPSRNSYQYDAMRIAGAAQLPSGYTKYERVTLEEVAHFDPEIILACGRHRDDPLPGMCPDCHSPNPVCQRIVEDIAEKPVWKDTSAAANGTIVPVPCHWLCRPGPRLIDGMESIAKIIQGSV